MPNEIKNVSAEPTKDFFISMLVKDIELIRAIPDLIDNCIDGAIKLRKKEEYNGLWVKINLDKDKFVINDNCGGFSVDTAIKYAFRFGRPPGMEKTPMSIGQFGVGMKRALFKMGGEFQVESRHNTKGKQEHFLVNVDVDDWKNSPKDWSFKLKEIKKENSPNGLNYNGTMVSVTKLHGFVSESFDSEYFTTKLARELMSAYTIQMNKGLQLFLNDVPLHSDSLKLLSSFQIKPGYNKIRYKSKDSENVEVELYAGISEREPKNAGWYVFCNGRMVLESDKSEYTGWGEEGEDTLPQYHNNYARFRGYAFFTSKDASLLPWNTTKTGIDSDSSIYKAVKLEIKKMTSSVLSFLKNLENERANFEQTNWNPLQKGVENAQPKNIAELRLDKALFSAPKPSSPPRPKIKIANITYSKPKKIIDQLKEKYNLNSNKALGEYTFDYFYKLEFEDEE
ncbi:ATP-binding protein [Candidatus Woesearchaeota archaeon]|jgi:hypothetical protein|nr:ATP-binding protein [archaeon]MBT4648398.1 ATP-binding protein [archaeon]MBT4835059.1 ATP-binding protein [Candidatus Woesearchaeota archaeon]